MARIRVRTLRTLAGAPPPDRLLAAVPSAARPVLLDSSDGRGWSLLAWSPDRSLEGRLDPDAGRPVALGRPALGSPDPGLLLEQACAGEEWQREDEEPPLAGGWLGWLGFECGHAWEPYPWTPPDPAGLPDFSFGRYRRAVAWSPQGEARLLWAELPGGYAERSEVEADFARLLAGAAAGAAGEAAPLAAPPAPLQDGAAYRAAVTRLREAIGAGELFQANLSHRLEGQAPADPRALYRLLRRAQPTEMSAYWEDGAGRALLSWSPERFLRVRGEELETRPIKGTAPRAADPAEDRARAAALDASEKERAELTMIVDMARNDLGRVARPGTVEVLSAGTIEPLPTVHHRVATVRARWDPARGLAALLAATFPPASVTGAPKVRALQAIAELEGEGRGPYCGSFLAWEPGTPRGDLSVLIRTAVVAGGRLSARVGAGIVWDSDPAREWEETLWKARYLGAARAAEVRA
jgi:para-aminobenzoate synthetase component 1